MKRYVTRETNRGPPKGTNTRAGGALDQRLRRYLNEGGFPEAQGADPRDRVALLGGYVDVVVLRDVIDRHGVTNPLALRWLQRQLLAHPGGSFSVKKHYDTLRSQGIRVGKDTLHAYLGYLEDAFLVRAVSLHTASERQRMVNPRKAYPVDPGLIALFARSGRSHEGRALETTVLLELERRGWEVSYLRTAEGWEVDFFAHRPGEAPMLVQVCLETQDDATWEREVRALRSAGRTYDDARLFLVTLDSSPPPAPASGTRDLGARRTLAAGGLKSLAHDAVAVAVPHVAVRRMTAGNGAIPCRRASAQVMRPFPLSSQRARAAARPEDARLEVADLAGTAVGAIRRSAAGVAPHRPAAGLTGLALELPEPVEVLERKPRVRVAVTLPDDLRVHERAVRQVDVRQCPPRTDRCAPSRTPVARASRRPAAS